jgi:glutamyl-tRNA synthetase
VARATALFSWAFAAHHTGPLPLAIEDTDSRALDARVREAVLEALAWIDLDWDPVPGFAGIPRQSERGPLSRGDRYAARNGHAYRCTCSEAEVEAMREAAKASGEKPRYDRSCRDRGIGAETAKPFCLRLRVPDVGGITRWKDMISGPAGEARGARRP